MNYQKHYNRLIETRKNLQRDCVLEEHHIIPKCMGGTDDKENLVYLTPEEHFVAHQLLVKIYPGNDKLYYAAMMMTVGNKRNNKEYGWLKRKRIEILKESQKGEGNPFYGKTHTEESRKRISETKRKQSVKTKGFSGRNHSTESKRKISESVKGMFAGEKNPMYGKSLSDETKKKLSARFKGKKMSDEFIAKISKPKGPQKRLVCTYCKKEGGATNMKRYHFENCKEK